MRKPIFLLITLLLMAFVPTASAVEAVNTAAPAVESVLCYATPDHSALLAQTSQADWSGWIAKLSGAEPVTVGGKEVTLNNRYSKALFNGISPAYDYLLEQVRALVSAEQIEEDPYLLYFYGEPYTPIHAKNLIVTIPGTLHPEEIVLMTAHFDSTTFNSQVDLSLPAPGADDNATGAATLLEAARILAHHPLPRTVRLIWFTGEEQGLVGSYEYLNDHPLDGIIGDINLDMYGYDGDNDRCFELHVSQLHSAPSAAASGVIGQCFVQVIHSYNLGLTFDYKDGTGIRASDHASFWDRGIGAVEVLENYASDVPNEISAGCKGRDANPYYHSSKDTLSALNLSTGFDIHRAALATLISLADPPPAKRFYIPLVMFSR